MVHAKQFRCALLIGFGEVFKRWVLQVHKVAINDAYQGVEANAAVSEPWKLDMGMSIQMRPPKCSSRGS